MRFKLEDYETVEERIKRFYADNLDGRLATTWESSYTVTGEQGQQNIWVIKAYAYLTAGDQANQLPKATGYAFEIDGGAGANATSALENAETSAIGRALANAGYSGKRRPSREEMSKANKTQEVDWLAEGSKILNVKDLRTLYTRAKAANASPEILEQLKDYAQALDPGSKNN